MADGGAGRRFGAIMAAELIGSGAETADLGVELGALLARQAEGSGGTPVPTGDGVLVMEFGGAGAAVGAARGLLQRVAERNGSVRDARRMRVRCAVHTGEYGLDGDRADTTALAIPRGLLGAAEPGGLILSAATWEQVRTQIPLRGVRITPRGPEMPAGLSAFLVPPADAPWLWWSLRHGAWKARAALALVLLAGAAGGLGWWLRHRAPAAVPAAVAVGPVERVLVLHELDDKANIYHYAGAGATVAWDILPEGTGSALQVRFTSGGKTEEAWGVQVGINRDLRPFTGLRVSHRGAPGSEVRFTIKDAEGEYWEILLAPGEAWQTVDLPFATFIRRGDYNAPGSNSVFNLEAVQGIELIQSGRKNSGTLMLDRLCAYGTETPVTPAAPTP